jgi:hypothetical protein
MPQPLFVSSHHKLQVASTVDDLRAILSTPDSRGGGEFWLATEADKYPCLAIRVSDGQCDVHYFPVEGHPGYRRLSAIQQNQGEYVTLRFEGCDPYGGEEMPAQFILPLQEGLDIASAFMRTGTLSEPMRWFEL